MNPIISIFAAWNPDLFLAKKRGFWSKYAIFLRRNGKDYGKVRDFRVFTQIFEKSPRGKVWGLFRRTPCVTWGKLTFLAKKALFIGFFLKLFENSQLRWPKTCGFLTVFRNFSKKPEKVGKSSGLEINWAKNSGL